MKIGILGGTFDPIHIAHTYMAEETKYRLNLDKIIVLPNGDPPHKDNKISSSNHRLNMAKLATREINDILVSDLEIIMEKPSYTYKTLEYLKNSIYKYDELYFIIGRDSLITFEKWYKPELILKYATLVCFDRPGYRQEEVNKSLDYIKSLRGNIKLLDSLEIEISSTNIRERIKEGKPIISFLHKDVYKYIKDNELYRRE